MRAAPGAVELVSVTSGGTLTRGASFAPNMSADGRYVTFTSGAPDDVFGDLNGKEEEFLRFDCFERTPHYHYAWSTDDEYVALDTTAEGDPLQWTLERLRTRLPAMLIRAGAGELTRTLDQRDIDAALPTIQGWAESLQSRERRER